MLFNEKFPFFLYILLFYYNLLLGTSFSFADQSKHGETKEIFDHDFFKNLTDPSVYNKHIVPQEQYPIRLNISIFLFGFGNIDESRTEFNLHLLLRISWYDKRLRRQLPSKNVTVIEGGFWHLDRLWAPSLHVPNSKIPNVFHDTSQNPVLTRVQSDGLILVSKRINLEGTSQMDFRLYPLDIQKINFQIESNELSVDVMRLYWSEDIPFSSSSSFSWNGYKLINHKLIQSSSSYTHTGNFSKVVATFYLQRMFSQFFLDLYVPIFLYVIVSWGSFWIEITAAPARVTLGVTVMLTMVTTARSAREKLPPVTYIHALDVWIIVCIVFVFGSIIEYTTVNYIYFREKRYQLKKNKRLKSMKKHETNGKKANCKPSGGNNMNDNLNTTKSNSYSSYVVDSDNNFNTQSVNLGSKFYAVSIDNKQNEFTPEHKSVWSRLRQTFKQVGSTFKSKLLGKRTLNGCEEIAYEIDRISRFVFPFLFIIFNIIYWLVLRIYSKQHLN